MKGKLEDIEQSPSFRGLEIEHEGSIHLLENADFEAYHF